MFEVLEDSVRAALEEGGDDGETHAIDALVEGGGIVLGVAVRGVTVTRVGTGDGAEHDGAVLSSAGDGAGVV